MIEGNRLPPKDVEPNNISYFTLESPIEFASSFVEEAQEAFKKSPYREVNRLLSNFRPRIGISAMYLEFFSKYPRRIFEVLQEGAMRGFNVEVHRDWYSTTVRDEDFLWLPPTALTGTKQRTHRKLVSGFTEKRMTTLKEFGATIVDTNIPSNPIDQAAYLLEGRNHQKIFFITSPDSMVSWIGGMNIAKKHFEMIDFMVKITDPRIVANLIAEFDRVNQNRRKKSTEVICTDETSIIIDALKDKSKIIQRAIADINSASKYVYVSSALPPAGEFLKALFAARKKGIQVVYLTSNPAISGPVFGTFEKASQLWARVKGEKIPLIFPETKLVHAKALVVDGKVGYTGSSNFRENHEELSLRSTNKNLISEIESFFEKIVGKENMGRQLEHDFIIKDPVNF